MAVKGRTVVSDLEAGMRSRKNKADGTERERRDWRSPDGERDRDRGRDGEETRRSTGNKRGAHAGIEMIDSIDWVSPARNRTRLAANTNEPTANATKQLPEAKTDVPAPSTAATADSKASEPIAETNLPNKPYG